MADGGFETVISVSASFWDGLPLEWLFSGPSNMRVANDYRS